MNQKAPENPRALAPVWLCVGLVKLAAPPVSTNQPEHESIGEAKSVGVLVSPPRTREPSQPCERVAERAENCRVLRFVSTGGTNEVPTHVVCSPIQVVLRK